MREVHPRDRDHPKVEVLLTTQNGAHRFGDLLGLEARRGNLVEEWLKEVVIVAIEQNHVDRGAPQCPRGIEAAEAAADDDDYFVSLRHSAARGS